MKINIRLKQLGKKKKLVTKPLEIADLPKNATLREVLSAIVHQQVAIYNTKNVEENFLPFLAPSEIKESTASGKVGFGSIYHEDKANAEKAVEITLIAFIDGIYAVFVDDTQIETLETLISLSENAVITFIRLTLLSGSYCW